MNTSVKKIISADSYSRLVILNISCPYETQAMQRSSSWPHSSSLLSPLLTSLHSEHYDFAESVRKHECHRH